MGREDFLFVYLLFFLTYKNILNEGNILKQQTILFLWGKYIDCLATFYDLKTKMS